MSRRYMWAGIAATVTAFVLSGPQGGAFAQEEGGTKTAHELRADHDKNLKGKTIAFLPIATGVPLMDEWGRVIKTEAEWRGMKFIIRDPALNPAAMQQALTALIDEKPDVTVVQESERHAADEGAQTRRGAGHPCRADEHVVQLQVGRLRGRRLV